MSESFNEQKENVFAGVIGALLFALAGGILWFVLYQIGYIAAISGSVGVICAVKGYLLFSRSKRESIKCLLISSLAAVAVLVLAWYLGISYEIHLLYKQLFESGEIDYSLNFIESVRVLPYFFEDSEFLSASLIDLGSSLLFAVLGIISYLLPNRKKKKLQSAAEGENKIETAQDLFKNDEETAKELFDREPPANNTTN